jgi:hypothetical protein
MPVSSPVSSSPNGGSNRWQIDEHELVDLVGDFYREAYRCMDAGAWRGAMILIGATVEAAMLAAIVRLEQSLRRDGYWPDDKSNPMSWPFSKLVKVSKAAGWLTPVTPSADSEAVGYDVNDAIRHVETVRNLAAHPGRYARDPAPDFSDVTAMMLVFDLVDRVALAVFDNLGLAAQLEEKRRDSPGESAGS